jgi:hypothetical protein
MSDTNVERLRALTAQWSTQNFRELGPAWRRGEVDLSPFVAPEVTYEDDAMPDHIGETFRGHEGMIRALESLSEAFEELTLELERIVGSRDCLVSTPSGTTLRSSQAHLPALVRRPSSSFGSP